VVKVLGESENSTFWVPLFEPPPPLTPSGTDARPRERESFQFRPRKLFRVSTGPGKRWIFFFSNHRKISSAEQFPSQNNKEPIKCQINGIRLGNFWKVGPRSW